MTHRPVLLTIGSALVAAWSLSAANPTLLFRDITAEAGITFTHHAAPEKKYIVESMSGGVAMLDYDNDGLIDLYFVDSLTVETAHQPETARSTLYRNLGNGKFADVTEKSGLAHPGWGMGVCTADVDGDGWEDLYVTGLGGNRLYHNNHDGTFTDIAQQAGVAGGGWSTGCGFADYDRDGKLDLFVRAARAAGRIGFSVPQRRQRPLQRGERQGRRCRRARLLRSRHRLVRL
jgi:hypothetical protein